MTTALVSSASCLLDKGQLRRLHHCCYSPIKPFSSLKLNLKRFKTKALKQKTEEIQNPSSSSSSTSAEEITKKYGLEAGLWKVPISLLSLSPSLSQICLWIIFVLLVWFSFQGRQFSSLVRLNWYLDLNSELGDELMGLF